MSRRLVHGVAAPSGPMRLAKGVLLLVICGLVIVPFIGVISTSIATPAAVIKAGGFVMFPDGVDLTAYKSILSGGVVTRALVVSIAITLVGTALSLFVTTLLGYALSRRGSFGQRPILLIVLFSMLFSPGMIPTYLMVKQVGLLNSYWALIVPTMVSAFNVIVVRSFFAGIPAELIESAKIDGANEWHIFRRVCLPLSKAVLAVIGLFYAVGYWNAFFNALLYINDSSKWPLQLVVRSYVLNNTQLAQSDLGSVSEALPPQQSLQMAILVISIVPILLVYPFLQKHFTKGVLTGAVKG
jgi:putative aldouronate transport system permease protein